VTERSVAFTDVTLDLQMEGNYTFDGFSESRLVEIDGSLQLDHCPPDGNPEGTGCPTSGVVCGYGYDPIECGGVTVICEAGTWVEREHTDPSPECMSP